MNRKVFSLIIIVVLIAGCSTKRDAIGEPDQMIIVADSVDWQQAKPLLQDVFAEPIPTPRPEPWYRLMRVSPEQFNQYTDYKNMIIFSLLREDSPSMKLINQIFSKSIVNAMKSGNQPIATKTDLWRKNQLIMILTTPTMAEMDSVLSQRGDQLLSLFDEKLKKRQTKYLYGRYEQKKMEKRLQKDYNWTFRVPRDWVIVHERPDSNFFWIGRNLPIRWLSVHWEKVDSAVTVDSALTAQLRIKMGQELYGDISTNPEYIRTENITIDGEPAIRIRGIWAHEQEAKGGPFTGAAYYDPDTQRLFYLDAQVFAPDLKKLLYLRQEEIVISTFASGTTPEWMR